MYGINGKPFINLDTLFPANADELHEEVCFGLASVPTKMNNYIPNDVLELELFDSNFKSEAIAEESLTPREREMLKNVGPIVFQRYLMFAKGAYFPWSHVWSFKQPIAWADKQLKSEQWRPESIKYFPKLISWIRSLPFVHTGRVSLFGVAAKNHVPYHRDSQLYNAKNEYRGDHHFIYVSGFGEMSKTLNVYDQTTKTKHPITARVSLWNDYDFHGTEPYHQFTYSLRVDGVLKPEFANQFTWGKIDGTF